MKQQLLCGLCLSILLLCEQSVVWAGFDEAREAYSKGDYASALTQFHPLAEQGDVKAQFIMGSMYAQGQGVERSEAQAVTWYRKAAEQGHAVAQERLGIAYQFGHGVEQNDEQAFKWFRRSAEQGDSVALYYLASMYDYGRGIKPDQVMAYMLYTLVQGKTSPDIAASMRDALARKLTKEQIAEGERLAKSWKVGLPLPTSSQTGK